MSQRELLLVLAHAEVCATCRQRLTTQPNTVFAGRALSPLEKEALAQIPGEAFITPETLARAAGVTRAQLDEYKDHPVARLRHF